MKNFTLVMKDRSLSYGVVNEEAGKIFFLDDIFSTKDSFEILAKDIKDYANFVAAFVVRVDDRERVDTVEVDDDIAVVDYSDHSRTKKVVKFNGGVYGIDSTITIKDGDEETTIPITDVGEVVEIPERYSKNPAIQEIMYHNAVSIDTIVTRDLVRMLQEKVLKGRMTIPSGLRGRSVSSNGRVVSERTAKNSKNILRIPER